MITINNSNLPPRRAYKFMEPKWLEKLKNDSKFFINHLNNYPESLLGKNVGDDLEGRATKKIVFNNYTLGSLRNEALEKEVSSYAVYSSPGSKMSLKNVAVVSQEIDMNQYVYCLTFDYNEEMRAEFGGSVLIIEDFHEFAYWINRKMEKRNNYLSAFDTCQYIDSRKVSFDQNAQDFKLFPGLIKDSRYSKQNEFRFLWRKNDNSPITKPITDLYVPEALKYCKFDF
ncbi:hypothetical protein P8891_11620 [Bacillus atrophaeus]|uniref:hypothetical protein n=1 Tax=Bacillus atrophaeus TaxID=1452 RepID=UPI00228075C2|nr:hypothetical protein [Bacillus atrophaeus]MCY7947656.1 hypothetical protein [Bacillus atrophaeus]MCY8098452.1 hypothetical protein [Bacillus atrophaeus]MCY9167772.1 hypothetical protein [Bacillus atrophaeus]MEC0741710.1 hypothetical protein [Bacillus atrophaeus]MEC0744975.1 hypothetical protein [Bacillus atrophaeus]